MALEDGNALLLQEVRAAAWKHVDVEERRRAAGMLVQRQVGEEVDDVRFADLVDAVVGE